LAALAHPNVVRAHELHCEGDQWFFTMELLEGLPLLHRLGRWAPAEPIRRAFAQVVAGVRALHAAGRVHRDLKPSNVMWTRDDRIKLLDLGLASEGHAHGIGQTLNFVLGTPAYMAPEQAAALPATPASDWYAVGSMLYEALTGRMPFEELPDVVLVKKRQCDPPLPSRLRSGVDCGLEALCMAMLKRDPEARPSGEEIASALDADAGSRAPAPIELRRSRSETVPSPAVRALRDALRETDEGGPRVLIADGTDLASAANAWATGTNSQRAVILRGRASRHERVPFNACDGLVDGLSRHLRLLLPSEAEALMPRHVRSLLALFPVMERVACVHHMLQRSTLAISLQDQQAQGRAALRELLSRLAERRPLGLLLEGAEHADEQSLALLTELLAAPSPPPLLLVVGYDDPEGPQARSFARALQAHTGINPGVFVGHARHRRATASEGLALTRA
jgi:hypothetical protein